LKGLLKEDGDDSDLTIESIDEYVYLVLEAFFGNGVKEIAESFINGFTQFLPVVLLALNYYSFLLLLLKLY
jgi:hypothetical protein